MVIRSSFKDYYDFVAKQYGGGDPKHVYVRGRLAPVGELNRVVELADNRLGYSVRGHHWGRPLEDTEEFMYLVVAGKIHLLMHNPGSGPRSDDPNDYQIQLPMTEEEYKKLPWWKRRRREIQFGEEHPSAVELCKLVGVPVFAITEISWLGSTNRARVYINPICPVLSKVGMASLVSPQQMYQEISMFVSNRMKDPPDADPPVELSNRQKIVKAGFDLVQSFRHRK